MDPEPIRVLLVHADPGSGLALAARLSDAESIEIVRVVYNRSATSAAIQELAPDVLLVDLMLPGYRSIDIIRATATEAPEVGILALAPAEPPHDRIMLAAEAGALGYVREDADPSEFEDAIRQVHQNLPWLPLEETYEILQEGAGELAVTAQERRARLGQVVLGLIPLTGLVAAITAYLWREYWSAIGVRVPDLGVDPTSRMIDVLVVLLIIIGVFGPLLFLGSWVDAMIAWIQKRPRLSKALAKAQGFHLGNVPIGRILFNRWIAWVPLALLVVGGLHVVTLFLPLIMVLVVGPGVGVVLLATLMGADDVLPEALHLPHLRPEQALAFLAVVIIVFLLILGTEVMVWILTCGQMGFTVSWRRRCLAFLRNRSCCTTWRGGTNRWGRCIWVATPTYTSSTTLVRRSSASFRSACRASSTSTRSLVPHPSRPLREHTA